MRVSRLIATTLLVVGLIVGTPAAASAAVPFSAGVPASAPSDFTPSGSKWRQWMVNLLSSVMGAATPSGYRAEQIANGFRYDSGAWEQMNARFGIDGVRVNEAGQMVGVRRSSIGSGSYTDVVIAGLEQQYNEASAKGKGPVRAPATPVKSFLKVVGGAAAVYGAFELGTALGSIGSSALGSWLGYDANGLVCSAEGFDSDLQKWIFRSMSGQNCDQFDLNSSYVENSDSGFSWTSASMLGMTTTITGRYAGPAGGGGSATWYYCIKNTGTQHAQVSQEARSRNVNGVEGAWSGWVWNTTDSSQCSTRGLTGRIYGNVQELYGVRLRNTTTGDIATVEQVQNDPERTLRCDVEYTDGSTLSGPPSLPYRESSGAMQPPPCPDTPAGKTPESVQVIETTPGITGDPLQESDVTPEYQEWWEQYPECRIGACNLDLIRVLPTPAVSCFDIEDGCVDWHTDPDKTENYLCRYGVHDVDLAECNVYAGLFQPGRITTGSPYSDPSTGVWSGGQNAPKPGGQAMNVQLQDPENPRSCNFPDFALDPISWVLTPVNCSMERNFVPRPTVVETHFAGAAEAWDGKPPQVIASAVETMALAPGATGCSRSVTLFGSTFPVIDACSGVGADIAFWSRMITSAAMVILVLVVVKRQIAGMVGYNQGQG